MDDSIKFYLSQIEIERMELKSSLRQLSFLLKMTPNLERNKEINRMLDRLKYLEELEKEIRKRI